MEKQEIIYSLFIGSVGFLILVIALIVFYIAYHKRILNQQKKMADKELAHEKGLLFASVDSQERERQRIASELHDDIGSQLQTLLLYLQQVNENTEKMQLLGEGIKLLDETMGEVRNVSHKLLPVTLSTLGLQEALTQLSNVLSNTDAIKVSFICNSSKRLPKSHEIALYRIIQELCSNTLKHANAFNILIQLNVEIDSFKLKYTDDGKGVTKDIRPGLGMKNMESRSKMIGAFITFPETNKGFDIAIDGLIEND